MEQGRLGRRPSAGLESTTGVAVASTLDEKSEHSAPPTMPDGSQVGFQNAFDQAAIGMALVDLDGRWVRVNPSFCKLIGYSEPQLLATTFQTITHPDDWEADLKFVDQLQRGDIPSYQMEKRYLHKAGRVVWVLLSVSLVDDGSNERFVFFSQAQDITERKHAEQALLQSEQRIHAILDNSPSLIFLKDLEGRYLMVNQGFERALGVSQEQIYGKTDEEVYPLEQAAVFRASDRRVLRTGMPMECEETDVRGDGQHTSIVQKFPLRDTEGKIFAIGAIVTDITGRKGMEQALRRSEARYRELVENTTYGVCQANCKGEFIDVNPALVGMLGYSSKEELMAVNLSTDIYCRPEDRLRLLNISERTKERTAAEIEWRRKDGKTITVRISGRVLHDESGAIIGTEGVIEDLTEWRELERQFRQAQKMEAVGRLAGGIAHDFNNLLTIIRGNADIIGSVLDQGHQKNVEQLCKAADRAASLTRQLLAFSRMQVLQPKVLNLGAVVRELGKMLPRLIAENIELTFRSDPALWMIKADPGQIEQVIVNLAVNARDAMAHGGKLIIETRNFLADEEYASSHRPMSPGKYVLLSVSDSGHGIDADTQGRIFEPFFTTKEQGKGTGLGLATVYGIVKQSGGFIWLHSEVEKGTTFEIHLPAVDEPIEAGRPFEKHVSDIRGTETILLAEDEDDLREIAAEYLRNQGYTVLEAKDGIEALALADKSETPIHMLVTDVVMPKLGGWKLAERLAVARPEMKIIYLSGYSEYSVTAPADSRDVWRRSFMQKPFAMHALGKKIREALTTNV